MNNTNNHTHGIRCQVEEHPIWEDGRIVGCRALVTEEICQECLTRVRDQGYVVQVRPFQEIYRRGRRPASPEDRGWQAQDLPKPSTAYAMHWARKTRDV